LSLAGGKVHAVVSGINSGPNLGQDVIYSGTVAGAREGALLNLPSFAVSVSDAMKPDYVSASKISLKLAKFVLQQEFPSDIYLNVNVPRKPKGIKVTSLCKRIYDEKILCRTDPRGHNYYWLAGQSVSGLAQPGTDLEAVQKGIVSVTPLQLNPAATHMFELFNKWLACLQIYNK
jgi:5'-nucleotidase